jgi:hypothetical protein
VSGHVLTWTPGHETDRGYSPPVGRCSCRLFSMIGPEDLVESFHRYHAEHPEIVTIRGAINRSSTTLPQLPEDNS